MRKAAKAWLIAASILVVLGLVILAGAMRVYDWDFSELATVEFETNTYEVGEVFNSIRVAVNITEVEFEPSDDEACRIVCYEPENVKHFAVVENGLLTIGVEDMRKWYDNIYISLDSPRMTVYLPHDRYEAVFIESNTGDIFIPKEFSFGTLEIVGDTADVECFASAMEELKIETDTGRIEIDGAIAQKIGITTQTGNITLKYVAAKSNVEIKTDTGKITLSDVVCTDLQAASQTGNINLEKVVASRTFSIESDTGAVNFDSSDAKEIYVETATGDVKGSLLTDKVFITETDTGRVDVPKTVTGGICEIITDTGSIILTIEK